MMKNVPFINLSKIPMTDFEKELGVTSVKVLITGQMVVQIDRSKKKTLILFMRSFYTPILTLKIVALTKII